MKFVKKQSLLSLVALVISCSALGLAGNPASAMEGIDIKGIDLPYSTDCNEGQVLVDCVVRFPAISLRPLQSLPVPSYLCPADHPWLKNEDYSPFGTSLIRGVSISGLGPVGVVITEAEVDDNSFVKNKRLPGWDYAVFGTKKSGSSATNWGLVENTYQVSLHCTREWKGAQRYF